MLALIVLVGLEALVIAAFYCAVVVTDMAIVQEAFHQLTGERLEELEGELAWQASDVAWLRRMWE